MIGTEMAANGHVSEQRDPCASPPCKRLKQAALPNECIITDNNTESSVKPLTDPNSTNKPIIPPPNQGNANPIEPPANNKTIVEQCTLMETESPSDEQTKDVNNTDPPLPSLDVIRETKPDASESDSDNCVHDSSVKSLNCSRTITKPSSSPKVTSGPISRFLQPVTPVSKATVERSKTPPSLGSGEEKEDSPCTPGDTKDSPDCSEVVSNPRTPIPAAASSNEVNTPTPKRRTPVRKLSVEEQLKREEERLKKQEEKEALEKERIEKKKEKERVKEEKLKERMEAKQKKEKEKLEQLELKKQREKERIEKKEQEERERKERMDKKEEEKRKKEEERKRKEDEKNLKNEEKRKKEEDEMMKKQKAKSSFASFFIKKEVTTPPKAKEQVPKEAKFQPFELKPFMKLSTTPYRKPLSEDAKQLLSEYLIEQATTNLVQVKNELLAIRELARAIKLEQNQNKINSAPVKDDDDDIMIIDDDLSLDSKTTQASNNKNLMNDVKAKLLQFHDNYRPAYFGSWRKKSSSVGARTPLKKDAELINYDVDSDEEWEEEEPGESLSNSEGEDEEDGCGNDEEEEQDGFFVPHGYLSDDERDEEDGMEHDGDNEKFPQSNADDKMQRHLAKQKTWEAEVKRQFKPMKPVAIGCIWNGESETEIPAILKRLEACCLLAEGVSIDPRKREIQESTGGSAYSSTTSYCNTAMPVPEEAMPFLIKMLHGNAAGLQKLVRLFRKRWTLAAPKDASVSEENWESHCAVSKRQVERKITSIAVKELRSPIPKPRWYVHPNILVLYKLENIPLPMNGLVSSNAEERSPSQVHLGSKSISPAFNSFTNVKPSLEKQIEATSVETSSGNTDEPVMDTTAPVILE